jgi:hypothetical protein
MATRPRTSGGPGHRAESVGVGTGSLAAAQLLAIGATSAFENLAAPEAAQAVLGSA